MPQVSLNQTFTVFIPLPVVKFQLFVVAKAAHDEHAIVLLMHIWIGGLSSIAVRVNVADVLFVAAAPALITMEPVGGVVSFVTVTVVSASALPSSPVQVTV